MSAREDFSSRTGHTVILAWTCAARALSARGFGIQPRMTLAWHSLNPREALAWTWEKTFRRYCTSFTLNVFCLVTTTRNLQC